MLPLTIAALLGLAALAVVVAPLLAPSRSAEAPAGTSASTLAERERAARAALHDVEFDYQLGNLSDDDYRARRERYMRRALAALKGRHDRERAVDEAIEAQVRALQAADATKGGARKPTNGGASKTAPTRRAAQRSSGRARRGARANHHQGKA
jgi:hypothetical protein